MNDKFIAIAVTISMMAMMWVILLQPHLSIEIAKSVGEDFCIEYDGVNEILEESLLGVLVLCNEWDPINKGIFGQDIKYQIRVEKDIEHIQDSVAFIIQFIIPFIIIAMLLDKKFNKKEEDDVAGEKDE